MQGERTRISDATQQPTARASFGWWSNKREKEGGMEKHQRFWRQRRNGGSHSQVKKDTKEEWWCKQPSESTLQPMLTLTTRQIHFFFQTLLKNSLPYERKKFTAIAARLQTTATLSFSFPNSLFPRLHCCSLALLFMYSRSLLWVTLLCPPASFFWQCSINLSVP